MRRMATAHRTLHCAHRIRTMQTILYSCHFSPTTYRCFHLPCFLTGTVALRCCHWRLAWILQRASASYPPTICVDSSSLHWACWRQGHAERRAGRVWADARACCGLACAAAAREVCVRSAGRGLWPAHYLFRPSPFFAACLSSAALLRQALSPGETLLWSLARAALSRAAVLFCLRVALARMLRAATRACLPRRGKHSARCLLAPRERRFMPLALTGIARRGAAPLREESGAAGAAASGGGASAGGGTALRLIP